MKMKNLLSSLIFILAIGAMPLLAQNPTMPQQQQEKIEVSDAELLKFAEVFQQMRMLNQQAQQEMIQAVEAEELELQRFNEIHQGKMDASKEVETSSTEDEKYEAVLAELQEIQPKYQEKMQSAIADSGLSMERYQQMAMALQSDAELQKRLQEMMKG